jgi:hypothetical protein
MDFGTFTQKCDVDILMKNERETSETKKESFLTRTLDQDTLPNTHERPPSTTKVVPVIYFASSEARNKAA